MIDAQTVLQWSQAMLVFTAFCVTTFPALYGILSPWYKSPLGRAVLLQSVSVALAVDLSVIGQFWTITTNLTLIFIINVSVLAFVGLSSLYLTSKLIIYNILRRFKENDENVGTQQQDV